MFDTSLNWSLEEPIDEGQWAILGIMAASLIIDCILWTKKPLGVHILKPWKLFVVVLHEFSHACAAVFTCGKVRGMTVNADCTGCTETEGGWSLLILSAGYVGSCFFGFMYVVGAIINIWTLRAMAIFTCIVLLFLTIRYARNIPFLVCNLLMCTYIGGMWAMSEFLDLAWPLQIVLVHLGVTSMLYSVIDIWQNLIRRKVAESDAVKIGKAVCCSSRLCGVIWLTMALMLSATSVYFVLVFPTVDFDARSVAMPAYAAEQITEYRESIGTSSYNDTESTDSRSHTRSKSKSKHKSKRHKSKSKHHKSSKSEKQKTSFFRTS